MANPEWENYSGEPQPVRMFMLQAPDGHIVACAGVEADLAWTQFEQVPGLREKMEGAGYKPVQVEVRILDDTA